MGNGIRIQSHFANCFTSTAVIRLVDSIRQQKLCLTLGSVVFDRNDHRRTNQYAILLLLSDDDAPFLDAKTLAQSGGNDDGTTLADSG